MCKGRRAAASRGTAVDDELVMPHIIAVLLIAVECGKRSHAHEMLAPPWLHALLRWCKHPCTCTRGFLWGGMEGLPAPASCGSSSFKRPEGRKEEPACKNQLECCIACRHLNALSHACHVFRGNILPCCSAHLTEYVSRSALSTGRHTLEGLLQNERPMCPVRPTLTECYVGFSQRPIRALSNIHRRHDVEGCARQAEYITQERRRASSDQQKRRVLRALRCCHR